MTVDIEYLIVGQGLAGSCLAYALHRAGKTIAIIDQGNDTAASRVGAGIMNPLVFRYITQSWKAEILLPFAMNYYQTLERELKTNCIHKIPIARLLGENEQDLWALKNELPHVRRWTNGEICFPFSNDQINYDYGAVVVNNSARVDMSLLVSAFSAFFQQNQIYFNTTFKLQDLEINSNEVRYKRFRAKAIIFCEGYESYRNHFFNFVPFRPVKGELLSLQIPKLSQEFIINKDIFILPIGNDLFKVGSNYDWDDLNSHPTNKILNQLLDKLNGILRIPYKLVAHHAGIRPSVADRRPVIGKHPEQSNVYIFNGLGAKGAMLAPFMTQQLLDLLIEGKPVWDEVDVGRFWNS